MGILNRTLAKVPLLGPVVGCLAGIGAAELGWSGAWIAVLGLLLGWALWRRQPALLVVVASGAAFWGLHQWRLTKLERAAAYADAHRWTDVVVDGTVLSLRDQRRSRLEGVMRLSRHPANSPDLAGALVLARGLPGDSRPGDQIRLRGRLRLPSLVRNPGEFDRRRWMRRRGLAAELQVRRVERIDAPALSLSLQRGAWELRQELGARIVIGLPVESVPASLIRGVVLGDRSGGGETWAAFRESGTMHVFAVSGLHVGLVGFLAWGLVRLFRVPRTIGIWIVLLTIWHYAFITGLRPPALRASLMASLFLVAFLAKRRPAMANSLLASVIPVLLLDSFQIAQAGFQLSYLVVGTIILATPFFLRLARPLVEGDPYLPTVLYNRRQRCSCKLREKMVGLFGVSLAAWLGSLPLIAFHFDLVTPSAVLTSMLLIPVVFLILVLAFLGVALGLLAEPLEAQVNHWNAHLADFSYWVARSVSAAPGSHFELRGSDRWWEGVEVFDLWNGDEAIYCGAGGGVLIDAGGRSEFGRVVGPALRQSGAPVASLVLTHPDAGHVGGMLPLLESHQPRQILLPVEEAPSPGFRELRRRAAEKGIRLVLAENGKRYPLGEGAELEVLRVPPPGRGRADDRGMVLRLHWRGWRILITGDAGFATEQELLASGTELASDVWVMGRHGSDFTGTIAFLQAVQPRVLIASEEHFPVSQRIPSWWADAVRHQGVELWRQGETGAVAVRIGEQELELRSFLQPKRKRILRR